MTCMITLTITTTTKEMGESVLFQPVLKAYPMHYSWILTAHISLGHLECHCKYFNRQVDKNVNYSCRPIVISAINLLNTDPSFDGHINSNTHLKRSLLPFLGDALRWLTGTATTKDVSSIKQCVNQLTETQLTQQETLVHIVSIVSVTRYARQVNRHSINVITD